MNTGAITQGNARESPQSRGLHGQPPSLLMLANFVVDGRRRLLCRAFRRKARAQAIFGQICNPSANFWQHDSFFFGGKGGCLFEIPTAKTYASTTGRALSSLRPPVRYWSNASFSRVFSGMITFCPSAWHVAQFALNTCCQAPLSPASAGDTPMIDATATAPALAFATSR